MAEIAAATADGEDIKVEVIEDEGEGQLLVIAAKSEAPEATESIPEPEAVEASAEALEAPAEAEAQPEDSESVKKPARKGKSRRAR